jgi:hypothetical protein
LGQRVGEGDEEDSLNREGRVWFVSWGEGWWEKVMRLGRGKQIHQR